MTRNTRIALICGGALLALAALSSNDEPSYDGGADARDGYSEQGYGPGGYSEQGYAPDGYGPNGYPEQGYSQQGGGYSQAGYGGGGGYGGGSYGGGYGDGGVSAAQNASDISDMSMQGYWDRSASSDETQRQTINGINGTADVYDAQSGTTYSGVDNSSDSYWADPSSGTVVGTSGYDNPDVGTYNSATNLDDM